MQVGTYIVKKLEATIMYFLFKKSTAPRPAGDMVFKVYNLTWPTVVWVLDLVARLVSE